MERHAALLRAVNVGGRNRVSGTELTALVTAVGLDDARAVLQSGNVVFRSTGRTTSQIEALLTRAALEQLGLDTDVFVRTASEWHAVIAANPFPDQALRDPGHLVVVFMNEAPARADVAALQKAIAGRETVRAAGKHAYIVYPDGIGTSRLTSGLIERTLGERGTARNWNTVLKLARLLEE